MVQKTLGDLAVINLRGCLMNKDERRIQLRRVERFDCSLDQNSYGTPVRVHLWDSFLSSDSLYQHLLSK